MLSGNRGDSLTMQSLILGITAWDGVYPIRTPFVDCERTFDPERCAYSYVVAPLSKKTSKLRFTPCCAVAS